MAGAPYRAYIMRKKKRGWRTANTALLVCCPAIIRTMLLAAAGLPHDLHEDLMQIGAGGV
jgi:hypothetical protein